MQNTDSFGRRRYCHIPKWRKGRLQIFLKLVKNTYQHSEAVLKCLCHLKVYDVLRNSCVLFHMMMNSRLQAEHRSSSFSAHLRQHGIAIAQEQGTLCWLFPSISFLTNTLTSSEHCRLGQIQNHWRNFFTPTESVGSLSWNSTLGMTWKQHEAVALDVKNRFRPDYSWMNYYIK